MLLEIELEKVDFLHLFASFLEKGFSCPLDVSQWCEEDILSLEGVP